MWRTSYFFLVLTFVLQFHSSGWAANQSVAFPENHAWNDLSDTNHIMVLESRGPFNRAAFQTAFLFAKIFIAGFRSGF